jgi:A/G-specific adenine glycosylase
MVAAVAAQQTQMSRVLQIYDAWVAAFPTLESAAAASTADVLRAWGRAGYPRRALLLREAAIRCVERHDGRLPRDREALLALPGVGPFTAGIVQCFGYGDDGTAVDTNVVRVIGRLVFGDLQPAKETPRAAIDAAAERLLRPGTAARWNPALMDYGARVCVPRPRCGECVVASLCAARPRFAAGETAEPVRAQARFEGSDRQLRGRILRVLRDAHAPVRRDSLLASLALAGDSAARADGLLARLCEEGFAWSRDGWCGLGEHGVPAGALTANA